MEKTTSKTALPELETEIAKLRTINKILTDWLFYGGRKTPLDESSKTRFDKFCILAPFAITDIEPLKKAIRQYRNHDELLPCLTKINALAEANLKLYGEGENKEQVKRTLFYKYENGKIIRYFSDTGNMFRVTGVNIPHVDPEKVVKKVVGRFVDNDNPPVDSKKEGQYFPFMFVVAGYCRDVLAYISEPINILKKEREAAKLKPLPHEGITVAQIALFFYYLSESKVLVPGADRKFFKTSKGHEKSPYNFTGFSSQTIYNAYRFLKGITYKTNQHEAYMKQHEAIMNPNNLKAVIPYLKKYPTAEVLAKKDLYNMERG